MSKNVKERFAGLWGLLLLLLFLALDGITSPMQEKLFKEYGLSKSVPQRGNSLLCGLAPRRTSGTTRWFGWICAQLLYQWSPCWVLTQAGSKSKSLSQLHVAACGATDLTFCHSGTGTLFSALSFAGQHPSLLGNAFTLSVAQDRKWLKWFRAAQAKRCHGCDITWIDLFFPQIAGSYRGSYFSMTGLLIPKIAKWSWCRRCVISQACLPSWFPFWAALGCRCCFFSQACLRSWFRFGVAFFLPLPPSLPSLSPFLISLLGCSWLPLPPCLLACFPSWFLFWAARGCRCHLIS